MTGRIHTKTPAKDVIEKAERDGCAPIKGCGRRTLSHREALPGVAVDAVLLVAQALCADHGKTAISGRKDSKGLVEQMLGIKPLLS